VTPDGIGVPPEIDYPQASPGAARAMAALEQYVRGSGLERPLLELVKIRASQINGCGYCLDMHTKDARAAGETEQRIYLLSAWREAPLYTPRERAAMAWTEALTAIAGAGVSRELRESVRREFTDKELVDLTMAVIAINGWNRLAIGFAVEPGSYRPPSHAGT
jgi:AhpD family alkylhydroperoxidase